MNFKAMFEDQARFNQLIFDKKNNDGKMVIDRVKELTFGVIEEALEFIKTYDFKSHRRSKLRLQNVAHSHEELVDMFKYWLSLCDVVDFPMDRLEELYYAKSRVVQYRYQEEWISRIDPERRIVVVDIDQVLGDYIKGICEWARVCCDGQALMQLSDEKWTEVKAQLFLLQHSGGWIDAKSIGVTHMQWQQVKHDFRMRGGKRVLPVFPDAKPFLDWIRAQGWLIVLMTSRPVGEYPNIFTDTLSWLETNQLPFDFLWWGMEKAERLEEAAISIKDQIVFAVDDSPRFVDQFRKKGVRTFHLDRSGITASLHYDADRVTSLDRIQMMMKKESQHANV